ncbi:A24 family peptidase [Streptomyces sp. NPDC005480]|uniref:prepilin peptidase n=1 Tax=Streptomyces sp. NPDC005480 TaxID=3154880 RepID=UPI0033A53BCF
MGAGWLIQPALYRLSVPAGTPWRSTCPDGHALPSGIRGWLTSPTCQTATHRKTASRWKTTAPGATLLVCALLATVTGPHPELLDWLLIAPPAMLLALVDARVHGLPDALTLPLAAMSLALLGAASWLPGARESWMTALQGAATLGAVFLLMFLISPRSMGFGDVKLALTLGAVLGWYGWMTLLLGLFTGYLIAAAHGIALLACGTATAKTALPFGPPLLLGALVGVAIGDSFA